eukprot:SAG31_NODE_12654_length_927_cov_0.664251_1_plen_53_part_10
MQAPATGTKPFDELTYLCRQYYSTIHYLVYTFKYLTFLRASDLTVPGLKLFFL